MTATTARVRRLAIFAICAAVVAAAPVAYAQRIWVGGGRFGGFNREPPKWAKAADFDGSFIYCRGFYTSVYRRRLVSDCL